MGWCHWQVIQSCNSAEFKRGIFLHAWSHQWIGTFFRVLEASFFRSGIQNETRCCVLIGRIEGNIFSTKLRPEKLSCARFVAFAMTPIFTPVVPVDCFTCCVNQPYTLEKPELLGWWVTFHLQSKEKLWLQPLPAVVKWNCLQDLARLFAPKCPVGGCFMVEWWKAATNSMIETVHGLLLEDCWIPDASRSAMRSRALLTYIIWSSFNTFRHMNNTPVLHSINPCQYFKHDASEEKIVGFINQWEL